LMRLSDLVALAVLVEAGYLFYFAQWMTGMYRSLHASWAQALVAGGPDWVKGLALVMAAALYWRVAQTRPWLRILAVAGAIYGAYGFVSVRGSVVSYRGALHGELVALSAVGSLWLVVIAVLAVADHYAGRRSLRGL
jgi:hypothetical protein